MCNRLVARQRKACGCLNLQAFMALWLAVSCIIAFGEIALGIYCSSTFRDLRRFINDLRYWNYMAPISMHLPDEVFEALTRISKVLMRVIGFFTILRGLVDIAALVCAAIGMRTRSVNCLYMFFAINVINYILNFLLFIGILTFLFSLRIAWFKPESIAVPFLLYGWHVILGPYILALMLSYIWVLKAGGNGTEWKSYEELMHEKTLKPALREQPEETETNADERPEEKALLSNEAAPTNLSTPVDNKA